MRRTKTTERVRFTRADKEAILSKTKNRCAHCGKDITVDTMTVEHAVPISRGGTNDDVNLVPLCLDCNSSKGFKVLKPDDYYKYIRKKDMSGLVEYFSRYCDSVDWFYNQNIFQYDRITLDIPKLVMGLKRKPIRSTVKVTVERAWYSDLDEIYYFLLNYAREYLDDEFIANLKSYMSSVFEYGCFYTIRSKSSGKVLAVFDIGYMPDKIARTEDTVLYEYVIGMYIYIDPSIPMSLNLTNFREYSNYCYYSMVVSRLLWEITYNLNKLEGAKGSLLPLSVKYWGLKDQRVIEIGICGLHASDEVFRDIDPMNWDEVQESSRVEIFTMGEDKGVFTDIECTSDDEMMEYRLRGQKFLEKSMSAKFKNEMISLMQDGVRVSEVIKEHNRMVSEEHPDVDLRYFEENVVLC